MRKTKSIVVTIVIIIYLLGIVPRQAAWAQEASPEPSPTTESNPAPDSSPEPDPSSSPDPSPSPSPDPSVDQQNAEPSPSPSPSPDPCVSDCPPAEVDQTNDAGIDNQVTDVSNTGDNTIPEPSPSPGPEDATPGPPTGEAGESSNGDPATISTGDAASEVDVVNLANTNLTNSDINYHILNIYLDENGNIDLSKSEVQEFSSSANLVVNQQNTATVNNTVLAVANSGQNSVNGSDGQITTGSASVVVNIINFINANLINANWNFVLINIFGHLTGNIVLPEPQSSQASSLGAGDITQTNNAEITNNVDAGANTGNNSIDGSGQVQTGNATSVVNLQTYANANLIGGNYFWLLINNFGFWNGTFWGWGTSAAQDPTYGQMLFNFADPNFSGTTCCLLSASQENNALLTNQITASANTGGNSINSNGQISTGNAFSVVNLLNFVNTNIISSFGFFGIINIFGTLDGDIGGVDHFPVPSPEPEVLAASQDTSGPEVRVPGGQLQTSMSTNVGTHVNPGDTVMFFITAANPGTGPVYDSKVFFNLYDSNDNLAAVQTFDLGKLNPGQRANISFGLVLANSAPGGTYYAVVEAQGKVGPDNQEISSQAETSFMVGTSAFGSLISSVGSPGDVQAAGAVASGGNSEAVGSALANYLWLMYTAFGVMGMVYFLYRISPKSYQLLAAYGRKRRVGRLAVATFSKFASKAMAFKNLL